ncbi:hypothetical protein [Ancylobacter oerskovii]|uniref:Uncharacterized protein n=1 Tax=Ancylobacter oerskovii TaxID=459519 RepID=A0ABW4Z2S7_9HYPH|nr:hypothetical protein [Ancylobacter oerskovii]MBS7546270.1 hypothetical protein [Ancylobacter oerskovii]
MIMKAIDPRQVLHDLNGCATTAWKWPPRNGQARTVRRQEYNSLQKALKAICKNNSGRDFQIVVHADSEHEFEPEHVEMLCNYFRRSKSTET